MFLYIERNGGGYNIDKYCFVIDLQNKTLKQIHNKMRNKEEILETIKEFKNSHNKDNFCFSTPNLLNEIENVELSNYANNNFNSQNVVYLIYNNKIKKIYEHSDKIIVPLNERVRHEIEQLLFVCGTKRIPLCY